MGEELLEIQIQEKMKLTLLLALLSFTDARNKGKKSKIRGRVKNSSMPSKIKRSVDPHTD